MIGIAKSMLFDICYTHLYVLKGRGYVIPNVFIVLENALSEILDPRSSYFFIEKNGIIIQPVNT